MRIFYLIIALCCFFNATAMQEQDPEFIRLTELIDSGQMYLKQGNYTQALEQFNKCIQLSDKTPERYSREKVISYFNIGNIHSVFSDYEHAYTYYLKGYNICRSLNDSEMEFKFLNNMTGICCFMKKHREALKYNETARKLHLSDKKKQEYTYTLNKGYIAASINNNDSALSYFLESVRKAEKYHMEPQFIAAAYSEICLIYENINQLDSAIIYLKLYNKLAEENKLAYMIVDSYKNLMRVYTRKGDKEAVLHYQDLYFHLSDSLMNVRDFYKITNEQQTYETNQSDLKIKNLNIKLSAWQKIVLFTVLVLLIFAVFIYFIYKQKNKLEDAYQNLFERNKELVRIEMLQREQYLANKSSDSNSLIEENNGKQSDVIDADLKRQILHRINEVMETSEEFCISEFSLNMLAKMVNSNTKYVSQIINETYGKNFRTFINEYRIKEARKRMMEDKYANQTIQSIAESVGYKSSTNFILAFKKTTGITPSIYQKLAKTDKNRSSGINY
jgi:AraC-like DNA-binding protein/tetratricopeptide (TPR) repeat protein